MPEQRIVVAGYFGYQNAGDEAILAETLHSIHTIDEKIDISVVGGDADYVEAVYGVTGILWKDSDAIIILEREGEALAAFPVILESYSELSTKELSKGYLPFIR